MNQQKRVEIANNTLEILNRGAYINKDGISIELRELQQFAVTHTKLYTPDQLDDLVTVIPAARFETKFEVENETTLDAARRLVNEGEADPLCLNFASAKNPGGGFLGGALAQEECIARASGLYPCLLQAPGYYQYHRSVRPTLLYSDHMIYSPKVPVIKDEDGELLDAPVCTSIITSAAVNAGAIATNERSSLEKIIATMETRIDKLLALCLHNKHEALVLGAWGCGVFHNDPEDISRIFRDALDGKYKGQFKRVVFAVKTNKESIIEPFRKRFAK
ncbi:MAG: TIGR02452 family protein [Chitinophagaceae bacterium]|nr:TIGR02452 family protein [Chitinophagaceae bacterium]